LILKTQNMDFSFVIVNALPQLQQAESFFVWWRVLSWIIIVVCPLCLAYYFRKYNKYETKDYWILAFILCAFIVIYCSLNSGLTLISGLLAVYALFYSTMSANYSSRKVVINSWAEKAVDHLRQFKDSDLAVQVARMQLVDKPNYFKVRDVLWYRSNKQEMAEKKLDVSYADDKLVIKIAEKIIYENEESVKINEKIIPESEYMVGKKIEWIKIYAKLDIEQYAVELIKKEFEVMAKNDVFAGTKDKNGKWINKSKLRSLWLRDAKLCEAQLQGANLAVAQLQGADLWSAQLQGANLHSTELQGAKLRLAELQGVNLCEAQLQGADLSWAKLQDSYILDKPMIDLILDEKEEYKEYLPDFTGVKGIDSAIFSDDRDTNQKVIAKIKQKHNLP